MPTEREQLLASVRELSEENAVLRGQLAHTVTHEKLQEEYEGWEKVYREQVEATAEAEALVMSHEAHIDELEIELARQRARDPVAETITWLDKKYRRGHAVVSDDCYKELVEAFISSLDPNDPDAQ